MLSKKLPKMAIVCPNWVSWRSNQEWQSISTNTVVNICSEIFPLVLCLYQNLVFSGFQLYFEHDPKKVEIPFAAHRAHQFEFQMVSLTAIVLRFYKGNRSSVPFPICHTVPQCHNTSLAYAKNVVLPIDYESVSYYYICQGSGSNVLNDRNNTCNYLCCSHLSDIFLQGFYHLHVEGWGYVVLIVPLPFADASSVFHVHNTMYW